MRRRTRLLRVAKWGGVVVCVLMVTLWGATKWRHFHYCHHFGTIGTVTNYIWVSNVDYTDHYGQGFDFFVKNNAPPRWWPDFETGAYRGGTKMWWRVRVPFWCIFAAVIVPTILAWRRNRRRLSPSDCPCGYDLTGNESGVCPECGRACASPSESR